MTNTSQNIYILIGLTPVKSFALSSFLPEYHRISPPYHHFGKRRANQRHARRKLLFFFKRASVLTKALPCAETTISHETKTRSWVQLQAAERSRRQATCARTRLSSLHETDNANRVQLQAVSLPILRFLPIFLCGNGTENISHALVDKQRNPCTNQSPANRITKYPC